MLNAAKRGIQLLRIGWGVKQLGSAHSDAERLLAQRALTALFSQARGVTMKVGQLFAEQNGDSPFRELLDNIEPLPLDSVLPLIDHALGQPHQNVFRVIDEAYAAASLGQVHHAVLHDGTEVAVKVRYPDIADAINAEMQIAGLMPGVGPVKAWGFDLDAYKRTLKNNMEKELDYRLEASVQQQFFENLNIAGLQVPTIFKELCREQLLVQSWEEGFKLHDVANWSFEQRQATGKILLKLLFTSIFEQGRVHADPHAGNYFFRRKQNQVEVVLLDYGCTVDVGRNERLALLKLIIALQKKQDVSILQCFIAMGFDAEKLRYVENTLPMLARILFRPFLFDKFRVVDWSLKRDFELLLGEKRWWFRSAGPANLLLLMRAFQGLAYQLNTLQTYLPWYEILLESVSEKTLQDANTLALPSIPETRRQRTCMGAMAESLYVKVTENGSNVAEVSMPAEVALDLKSIMPAEVLTSLEHAPEINLDSIIQAARESGFAPQTLFEHNHGNRRYRVWLK